MKLFRSDNTFNFDSLPISIGSEVIILLSNTNSVNETKLPISDGNAAILLCERSNFSIDVVIHICFGIVISELLLTFNCFTFGGSDGKIDVLLLELSNLFLPNDKVCSLVSLEIGANVLFSTRRLLSQLSDLRSFNCCSPVRDCILFFDISNVRSDVILFIYYEVELDR